MLGIELMECCFAPRRPIDAPHSDGNRGALPIHLVDALQHLLAGPFVIVQIALDIQRAVPRDHADHCDSGGEREAPERQR